LFVALLLLLACVSSSYSFDIPEGVALTPSGYFPSSCVHGPISPDHLVVNLKTHTEIQDQSGNTLRVVQPCSVSRETLAKKTAPLPSGWAAYTWSQSTGNTINSYNGSWTVPVNPKDKGSQTLFLFTGMQDNYGLDDDSSVTNIIQPVLQWGPSEAGGGEFWAMASWYVDSVGNAFFSTLTTTKAGNNIQGNMEMNMQTKVWEISTIDTITSKMTTLNIATNTTEPYAFVTLEVYTVSNCGEYPTGSDTFMNLVVKPKFTPQWTPVTTPGCEEAVTVNSPSSVTISF